MKLRNAVLWSTLIGCASAGAAIAQTKVQGIATPFTIEGLWAMAQNAGIFGTAVMLFMWTQKNKEVTQANAKIEALTAKNDALHERYLNDIAATRLVTQSLEGTVSRLITVMVNAVVEDVREGGERA